LARPNLHRPLYSTTGITRSQRIGSDIAVKGIDFRYRVTAGSTGASQAIRVILLASKENTTAAVADVLETSYLGTVHAPYAFFNRDKRSDFTILHDQIHEFDLSSATCSNGFVRKSIRNSKFPSQVLPPM